MTKPGFRKTHDDVFGPSVATTLKSAGTSERRKKKRVIISSLCATSVTSSNGNGLLMITIAPISQFLCSSSRWHWTYDISSKRFCEQRLIRKCDLLMKYLGELNIISKHKKLSFLARYCKIINAIINANDKNSSR